MSLSTKQWQLAGKFVEFEYSPKICHFWRIQVLAKMVILENWPDSIYSPTFANLFWPDSIHSPTFTNLFWSDSIHSPTFANLVCSDLPDSRMPILQVLCEFGESGKFGEFSECRLDHFKHIKYVICA
jgi:hypothetical protein